MHLLQACSVTLLLAFSALHAVKAQSCSTGWNLYNNKCWYFSDQALGHEIGMTWLEAESWCQQNNGHLASFATADERDWAYYEHLDNWDDTRWWIGLTDSSSEGSFKWTDGTPYDPAVANWKVGEPSNSGKEDCIEVWIDLPLYKGAWNDNQCDKVNPFICKRDVGNYDVCPVGWSNYKDSCYKMSDTEKLWHDADIDCKILGGNLVAITSPTEQGDVAAFVAGKQTGVDVWTGLSDTDNPGTLQWSDHESLSYTNFLTGQPQSPLPYKGSTCVEMSYSNSYFWGTGKCSQEKRYVCERGLSGSCPVGWLLLAGKCYEIVINENRLQTWTTANEVCKSSGGTMLKIETDEQEMLIGNVLQQFSAVGFKEIWLGGSDLAKDDVFTWSDSQPIVKTYWGTNQPQPVAGREDCMSIYTGKSNHNWETSSCFYQRPFICELPEGSKLPPGNAITVEGKCDDGWRHFRGYCYLFRQEESTQSAANSYCTQNGGKLTSVLNDDEQSFIVGNINNDNWIGLTGSGGSYSWMDGSPFDNTNWVSPHGSNPCVYVREADGLWVDDGCSVARDFVCKKVEIPTPSSTVAPPTGDPTDVEKCGGGGWFSNPASSQCYAVNALQARTWSDARRECQLLGGELASINTPEEQAYLHTTIGNFPTVANVWTGGADFNSFEHDIADVADSGWEWTDGSPFNYLNWEDGEPNNAGDEDCLEMYVATGRWNDIDCNNYKHYICEKTGNTNSIIGNDIADSDCKSSEACCFRHLGVEYGGVLSDDVLTASSQRNKNFNPSRGRLNTPADVVVIGGISIGNGQGAWEPRDQDTDPWLQVDFARPTEIKGIITQGREGLIQYTERQWTTSYKISYSQSADGTSAQWEWLSDSSRQPIIFDGNRDLNTQVTNLFPRPIVARHVRCHPVTWKDNAALRLEYIGCGASCLFKLGMNSGTITDAMITASSVLNGKSPSDARAPVDNKECLASSSSNKGADYRGWISKTESGRTCQRWNTQSPHSHSETSDNNPNAGLDSNFCRNPNGRKGPWCYTTDTNTEWEYCTIPTCPTSTPTGWSPTSSSQNEYVQVQFDDFYKVSGVTIYKQGANYVTSYALWFSDDGTNFKIYTSQDGSDHMFTGVDANTNEFMDILREPISTKFVRIQPRTWSGSIVMQFEINGCYVDRRITCGDIGTTFQEDSFSVTCPSGCVEDSSAGKVYGTTVYTENSAICPAAIHAGRVTNNHGGSVNVIKTDGLKSYGGSFANGITSYDAASSGKSIEFDGSTYRCDDGWRAWKDHCYFLSYKGVLKNWQDARADCQSMGSELASIWTSGENDFLEGFTIHADVGGDIWIGLNDLDMQNYYQWSDGTPVSLTKWRNGEPNGGGERCVNFYRVEGKWNDKECQVTLPYLCKKEKQLLPPLDPGVVVTDEGCDEGWSAYGSSCYLASTDEYIFIYGNRICEESGGKLASVHDDGEQAFVHALVTSTIPANLGYTSWIGLAAKVEETGGLYYTWETGEAVAYTNWDNGEPDVRFSCAFPFKYQGQTFYSCTTFNHPARLEDTPWCSIDPIYRGRWINCGTGDEYGCTFMDDQTGKWQIDICGQNRYYICEKNRVGYTQPVYTTPSTSGTCAPGWYGDSATSDCYQVNEFTDRTKRLTWPQALDYCRAQGADLVSIHSNEEQAAISRVVVQQNVYSYVYFWMGLNDLELESGYTWTDGSAVSFTSWGPGEPNDHQGLENCVEAQFYDEFSGWNDLNCDAVRNWICKIPKGTLPSNPPTYPPPQGTVDSQCGTDVTWIRFNSDSGDKCYAFLEDVTYGWQYAENDCVARGGHLTAIHGTDENTFLLSRAARMTSEKIWIGMRDIGDRAFAWSDGTLVDYQNWASGEPNNYYDSEGCVDMSPDGGLWNDDNCGVLNGYICEKFVGAPPNPPTPAPPITGNCPEGFTAYGNGCYMTGGKDNYFSWKNASDWCTSNNAKLAVINNQYEQAFLNNFLWGLGRNFWIGLSDRETGNGKFVWVDQSEVAFTNWKEGEPSGNGEGCTEIMANNDGLGTWNDLPCENVLNFVCSKTKDPSLPAPPPTESPLGCGEGFATSVPGQACYKLYTTPMSYDAARDTCRSAGYDLVSIPEIYDNDLLKSWFWQDITGDNARMWIGLTFTVDQEYNRVTFVWDDGWPNLYSNWGPNEPNENSLTGSGGCVLMNNDGSWSAVPQTGGGTNCASALPFACKLSLQPIPTTTDPTGGICEPGFFLFNQYCYYVEFGVTDETTKTWYESAYTCEERGAQLVSFHNEDEVMAVINHISDSPSHNLFIGLSSNGFGGWKWTDDSAADFFNWGANEPNGLDDEECVEMYPWDGTWNDIGCNENRGFVCRKHVDEANRCAVQTASRTDCGFPGIDESYCVSRRGCCWDDDYASNGKSGCFYPQGSIIGPSGEPVEPTPNVNGGGGLSGGAIAGIIIGVLVAVGLVGVGAYCFMGSGGKGMPSVSMPSFSTTFSSSTKSSTPTKPEAAGGFDNPMALGDDGTSYSVA